jgi:predicted extracellular nuclease/methionine-rich copper-binding protein CopC
MVVLALVFAALPSATPVQAAGSPDVVISQVYGGGGSAGAPYTNDFVELFNRGTVPVSLNGWSIQYASATGVGSFGSSATMITPLPNVLLQPGQYYLIQGAGGSNGSVLPTPDVTDGTPIAMAQSAGKVALARIATGLGCNGNSTPCNATQLANIVDLVGYGTGGSGANFFEGTAAAPTIGVSLADFRASGGCMDTDVNSADFATGTPAPRNSSSTRRSCIPISSTTPASGAVGVATNANVDITFSEAVTLKTNWYTLSCVVSGSHTATVTNVGNVYTLNPDTNFSANELCTATVLSTEVTGATNDAAMAANYAFTFTTAAPTLIVASTNPANGATNVAANSTFVLNFSESVNVTGTWYSFDCGGTSYVGTASAPTTSITLTPSGTLPYNTSCTVTVTAPSQVTSVSAGTSLTGTTSWSFTTEPQPLTVLSTNPAAGASAVPVSSTFEITFSESAAVTAPWYSLTCNGITVPSSVSPASPSDTYTITPAADLPEANNCNVTLTPANVASSATAVTLTGISTWNFTTYSPDGCVPATGYPLQANIGTVQGTGTTPLTGPYTVKGTITNRTLNKNTGSQYGLYIQDSGDGNTDTSDGLFVYTSTQGTSLAVGTAVMVSGTVSQYKNNTQITPTAGGVVACGNAATITPVTVNLPTDSDATILLEKYENMLVHLPQTFTIDQNYFLAAYGQMTISPNGRLFNPYDGNLPGTVAEQTATVKRSMLVLDDNNYAADPNPPLPTPYISRGGYPYTLDLANITRAGDLILGDAEAGQGLTGILDQGAVNFKDAAFSPWYRLQPTVWPTITAGNLRTTAPTNPGGNVKVAGFNLENYFTTMDDGTNPSPYDTNNTPRGANNADEFARQKAKTVKSIIGLGADVTGVIELENNGPTAISDLLTALNAQAGAGTYAYVVDDLPTAAQVIPGSPTSATADYVKVGIFYKPAVVTPVGSAVWSPADIFSRQPLAQTFKVNASGEKFTVVVNHFKSKSSCPSSGDVDTGQGCWNLKRVSQANELINFINTTLVPVDPDVIALGDFNANGEEDPIKTLTNTATAGYLVNTLLNIPAADRYTYVFDGQAGYIDQMLVTPSLDPKRTGVTVWHINADEPLLAGYNTEGKAPLAGYPADLYDASVPNRSSDHDPVLLGLNLNDAPQVANAIPNQSVAWGTPGWSFAFAPDTFSDANVVNGDGLTYSATLADGSALPAWLTFTPPTRTFSGTPNVLGALSVKVTATDKSNASASTTFTLTVTIALDGNVSEWPANSLLGTASSTEFRITWDDDYWYFSVKNGLDTSNFFMVGIDADPTNHTTNTGGTLARCGATFPTQNKPDFILTQRQSSYLRESYGWDGADWNQASWNPVETGDYDFSGSTNTYEVKLRKSTVFATNEDTSPVGFYLWLSDGSCRTFNAWPPENHNGWTGSDQFLYAHTYFETTDAGQAPSTYNTRVGWDTQTLSSDSTAYNFFGADDYAANPWLRMTTNLNGAGGAICNVTAQLVGNRAFPSPAFTGINRYIDFTFNNCTNLNVDVQMRYEQNEVVSTTESAIQFYHCSLAVCGTSDWLPVTGVTYTRDTVNNNLLLTDVAQSQFSKWMSAGPVGPTAIAFNHLSARSDAASTPLWIGFGLLLAGALVFWRKYFG